MTGCLPIMLNLALGNRLTRRCTVQSRLCLSQTRHRVQHQRTRRLHLRHQCRRHKPPTSLRRTQSIRGTSRASLSHIIKFRCESILTPRVTLHLGLVRYFITQLINHPSRPCPHAGCLVSNCRIPIRVHDLPSHIYIANCPIVPVRHFSCHLYLPLGVQTCRLSYLFSLDVHPVASAVCPILDLLLLYNVLSSL